VDIVVAGSERFAVGILQALIHLVVPRGELIGIEEGEARFNVRHTGLDRYTRGHELAGLPSLTVPLLRRASRLLGRRITPATGQNRNKGDDDSTLHRTSVYGQTSPAEHTLLLQLVLQQSESTAQAAPMFCLALHTLLVASQRSPGAQVGPASVLVHGCPT
jgi:hypothetical protein